VVLVRLSQRMVLQEAIITSGLATLDYPELKFSIAASVEHFKLPFICCVWMYVVASYINDVPACPT
jgi:hypothetical protein